MLEVYCWVYVDNFGNEGIIGLNKDNRYIAAVFPSLNSAMKIRNDVKDIAEELKIKVRLVRFIREIVCEEIDRE